MERHLNFLRFLLVNVGLVLNLTTGYAQWIDQFSQSTLNAAWEGDKGHFTISNNQLKLSSTAAGTSQLFRRIDMQDSMEWSFYLQMGFATSATNFIRIFLAKDSLDESLGKSYYLEIGENGNTDRWKFYSRDKTDSKLLGEGEMGKLATDPVVARIRIRKHKDFRFTVSISYDGTENFVEHSTFKDISPLNISNAMFSLKCFYTDTRKDKFFFDDIAVNFTNVDVDGPDILGLEYVNESEIAVLMNEEVDLNSLIIPTNVSVEPSTLISNIGAINNDASRLKISFVNPLISGQLYTLFFKQIKDRKGNISIRDSIDFSYTKKISTKKHDIIITEFMADPSPTVALPEVEYVELYNGVSQRIDLTNFNLADASGKHLIRSGFIDANSFVILCNQKDTNQFKPFGKVIGLSSFPSINNSGDQLYILNELGELLHELEFDLSWYQSSTKSDGGYSLEMSNPNHLCKSNRNWSASNNPSGGTPGQLNSVWSFEADTEGPKLLQAYALSEWEIKLIFDESLDEASADFSNYILNPSNSIAAVELTLPSKNELILLLNNPLQKGQKYNLKIQNIKDCLSNVQVESKEVELFLPSDPLPGELVINEILFNPFSGGVDYIEIFNPTSKVLSVANLFISNLLTDSLQLPIKLDRVMSPGSYLVATASPENVIQNYPFHDSAVIYKALIPSLDDKSGIVQMSVYSNFKFTEIDRVKYDEQMHNPLLESKDGVSLERIHPKLNSGLSSSWQSCSEVMEYGTPGIKNSQYVAIDTALTPSVQYKLSSEYITPNGDGDRDFLFIQFLLTKPGTKIHVEVFDLAGLKVKDLSQVILGTNDVIKWQGDNDSFQKLPTGNYLLHITYVNLDQKTLHNKAVISVINK
ncbi:MAG: lamin tail domain-containing protein [Saprospiraceae bacterium]|nr:lamin tail domain-containing protein [Saprospiraceae bacterium]